jgi:beta-barrel assembly-enhancing protease
MLRGAYFDGESTKPAKVEIKVTPLFLLVHLPGESEEVLKWEHDKIHIQEIPGSSKIAVNFGDFPYQSIEVEKEDLFDVVGVVNPLAPYLKSTQKRILSNTTKWLLSFLLVLVSIGLIIYFLLIPVATNIMVSLIPIETEIELGKKMAESMLAEEKIDKEKSELLNQFYKSIKTSSKYPIRISVVDSDIKNAFAIPGGQIVVYTGLLNEMKHYPELVALLGHEKAHVDERHSLRSMAKSLGLYIVVSLVVQDVNGVMAVILENASKLQQLSYSREFENEADDLGLELVLKNKVDPKGMVALFRHLKSDDGQTPPEFLSTHPDIDGRIRRLQDKLPELKYQVNEHRRMNEVWVLLKQ